MNNFSRWHQRVQAEQERCIGLERTVEQLARQHRALEIQLSQCYSYPPDELNMDTTTRSPREGNLGRGEYDICIHICNASKWPFSCGCLYDRLFGDL